MGCGVTAHSVEEATMLLQERVFQGEEIPPISKLVSDIDVSMLDPGHVRPNMGNPVLMGVWFSLGY